MKLLLKFMKPYGGRIAVIAILQFFCALSPLLLPYFMSEILDSGIAGNNWNAVIINGAIMLAIAAAALVFNIINYKLNTTVTESFTTDLRSAFFKKVNSLTFEEYNEIGASSLLTRQTEDVNTLREIVWQVSYFFVCVPVMFFGGITLALLKDWLLALIMLAAVPFVFLLVWLVSRNQGKLWRQSNKAIDRQNALVRERLSGLRVIRAFNKEDYEHARIEDATNVMARSIIKANVRGGFISPIASLLLNIVTVLLVYFGAMRMGTSALRAGDVVATVQYVAIMTNGLLSMSWMLIWLPHLKVSLDRVNKVFGFKGMPKEENTHEKLSGNLKIEGLTFAYSGGKPVLRDISLDIAEGETVGIIGGTGSGKTTLSKLILGFYTDYDGEISLGGRNYREVSHSTLRDNISIALQKSMIFEGTAGYNVKMGNREASDSEMRQAAVVAAIDPYISSKEEGYDYRLSGGGTNLSGGQKQRINIARTILKPASLYVFDDSFSALDFLTEKQVRTALNERLKGKTQIIITQRVSTAMRCDRIIVMDDGEIVGSGSHERLLKDCKVYGEFYRSQMGGRANENA